MAALFTLSYIVGVRECFVKLNSNHHEKKLKAYPFLSVM